MNYKAIADWLAGHGIVLEESFTESLQKLAREYKKTQHTFNQRSIFLAGMFKG